ncbi:MAG: acyltransferase [Acidocella sp.]|nr:acyltransferase [Acidocella sp.]
MPTSSVSRHYNLIMTKPAAQRTKTPLPKIISIQYLRAFAAMSVAVYHILNQVEFQTRAILPLHILLSAGVDLFFCVSGFIIWTTNWYSPLPLRRFAWNRITRVVPMYWIFTLFALCVAPFSHYAIRGLSLHGAIYSLLFLPYTSWNMWPILGVGWTLNYEMFFYALFALVLLVAGRHRLFPAIITSLCTLVIIGLLARFTAPALQVYTNILLLEFVFGILIGWLVTTSRLPTHTGFAAACLIIGFVLLLLSPHPAGQPPTPWRGIVWGIPCALILMGTIALERSAANFQRLPKLILLGDASYALYLTHAYPIMLMTKLLKMPWWPQTLLGFTIFTLLTSALIIATGILAHLWLEKPLLRLAKNVSILNAPNA